MREPAQTARPTGALFPRSVFDLVVIGASAGGVGVIKTILSRIPFPFATPIAIVQHLPPVRPSLLPDVFSWRTQLDTRFAQARDRLRPGTVFLAPPDQHLIVGAQRRFELENSPKVSWVRPSADRLFMTAAAQFGSRLLCIVLTGMGHDGAAGAAFVKQCGGVVIVQELESAEADGMPSAAMRACTPDFVLPPHAIASAMTSLCEVIGTRELFCGSQLAPGARVA